MLALHDVRQRNDPLQLSVVHNKQYVRVLSIGGNKAIVCLLTNILQRLDLLIVKRPVKLLVQ